MTKRSGRIDRAIEAHVNGNYSDPFALLGPHQLSQEDDGGRGVVIRACHPAAQEVEVLRRDTGAVVPMARRHPYGFYEAAFDDAAAVFDYRLRVTYPGGHNVEVDDPYRYGRVIDDYDLHLFSEGSLLRAYDHFGAHVRTIGDASGVHFAVWAPNAERVSVVGDFNGWDGRVHSMRALGASGVWEIFVPGLGEGERYKFEVRSRQNGALLQKADPYGFGFELPPKSASVVTRLGGYEWRDRDWLDRRAAANGWLRAPMAAYEVHLGSWARVAGDGERFLSYRELAERLVPYAKKQGYTHLELLPVMEHPFSGSWGYQVVGYYAPTSRHGAPEDFKYFVDECHRHGLGVILDWVPGHFPKDAHGLARFDGTALYEHEDPRQGEQRDWGTLVFNYGRNEVRNFLTANALFWLDEYHVDGLRVDAVASMLYLDYSRSEGEWVPNRFGGRENLEAIDFLRHLNALTHERHPGSVMIAEESTAFPAVSRPTYVGGLGFTFKWNMGWMHDILLYAAKDPVYRRWEHRHLTFSMLYAFSENFVLPFSHDEVVHGKRSMLDKMPGDVWQKAANLRALYGFMYGHPGKKLMFMGCEFGQWREWAHDRSLDWHLLDEPVHEGLRRWVEDLNWVYQREPALHEMDGDPAGFEWIDCSDNENSVIAFLRRASDPRDSVVIVMNFTPVPREGYLIGVPEPGRYRELLNSDADIYGGGNVGNGGGVWSEPVVTHGRPDAIRLTLPPLGCLMLKKERE
jgi:1,4-alpha-glucan branching enzyme